MVGFLNFYTLAVMMPLRRPISVFSSLKVPHSVFTVINGVSTSCLHLKLGHLSETVAASASNPRGVQSQPTGLL